MRVVVSRWAVGRDRWNEVLSRIEIESDNINELRTFYSCLYRSTLFPRMFYEKDAKGNIVHYSPHTGKVLPGYMFTDTGFWDTFRGLLPLINLVYPEMSAQMEEGFYNSYKESGFYPEWATPGHRACMVGNNSASVVADAYVKGNIKKDTQAIFDALCKDANSVHPTVGSSGRTAYKEYNQLGYVPSDVVVMLCIMSAVVRIYAVVNGFGSFHGVQLSTVTVLIAAIVVVNAISHITCLLNLSQETSRPNSVDAPGRQEEYIVLRHLILS